MCADSVVERGALREQVFPAFRQHCRHTLGLDIRVSECGAGLSRCGDKMCVVMHVVGGAVLLNILPGLLRHQMAGQRENKLLPQSCRMNSELKCVFYPLGIYTFPPFQSLLTSSHNRESFCLGHSTKARKKLM